MSTFTAAPTAAFAQASTQASAPEAATAPSLRSNAALLRLDYQSVKVPGD